MKLTVRNWKELLAQLPSWIECRFVLAKYAGNGGGIELTVPELKPALELPEFPDTVRHQELTAHFTVRNVSRFLAEHCGTNRNYAARVHGTWFEVSRPFVTFGGKRVYVSPDEMEAASILACMSIRLYDRYAGCLAARQSLAEGDTEAQEPAPEVYAQYGL